MGLIGTTRRPLTKRGQPRLRAPGAGRPQRDPEAGLMERRTAWLYPAQWAEAERLGDGVASAGLRRIIDALATARKRKAKA